MFFANEQRENVRDENPGITFGSMDPPLSSLLLLTRPIQVKSERCSASDGRR
jgi:hypothetical protein